MVRRIGPTLARPLASVAERSAAARSRQHRFTRRARFGCRATQSATNLINRLGEDALFHIRMRADAGLASGDFETYALWQKRRRAAERLLKTRWTGVLNSGGKA